MDLITILLLSGLFCAGKPLSQLFLGLVGLTDLSSGARLLWELAGSLLCVALGFWPIFRLLRIERLPRCPGCGNKKYVATEGNPVLICSGCYFRLRRLPADTSEVLNEDGSAAAVLVPVSPKLLGLWKTPKNVE